jgi:Holliday junction resolvase
MSRKPESNLQRRIQKHLGEKFPGCKFFKVHGGPFMEVGLPDLVGSVEGRFVAIEVKQPGEDEKPIQAYQLRQFAKSGAITGVVHSPQEAERVVTEGLRKAARLPKNRS